MPQTLITGGAGGLGRALAHEYMHRGSEVTILDVDRARGEQLTNKNRALSFLPLDLRTFSADRLQQLEGPFDHVICNAGISLSGRFRDIAMAEEREVFEVNVLGHLRLLKRLLQEEMISRDGRIAFICSMAVFCPLPISVSYTGSKAALGGCARALEAHLTGRQISVTRVYPGPMSTRHHEKYYDGYRLQGGTEPERLAPAIVEGIAARKRKMFPSVYSRLLRLCSMLFPRSLQKLSAWLCRLAKIDSRAPDETHEHDEKPSGQQAA